MTNHIPEGRDAEMLALAKQEADSRYGGPHLRIAFIAGAEFALRSAALPKQSDPSREKLAEMLKHKGFTSRDGTALYGRTFGVIDAILESLVAAKPVDDGVREARPNQFLAWACETFTVDVAMNPSERLMRFVEEAVELAFACDMPRETLEKIMVRVYSRNPGNIEQEAAQCQVTLELWAKVAKLDLEWAATREFERVQAIPKEEWDRRHSAKVAIGIALSPSSPGERT